MVILSSNNFLKVSLILSFFLFCRYPEGPKNIDIVELEHVWQYCKAFSLYSERVPPQSNLLNYSTNYKDPNFLLNVLNDSLFIHWKNNKIKIADYDRSFENLKFRLGISGTYNFAASGAGTNSTVFFKKLTKNTAYLKITEFKDSTDRHVSKCDSFADSTQNIIIDLRKNGGGLIEPCRNIIELFLPSNIAYIQLDSTRTDGTAIGKDIDVRWVSQNNGDAWEGKNITILIDSQTASASEILTVSLRDGLSKTFIIGTKSLGKAIGQNLIHLKNDAGMFLTVMRFKPLNGVDYHETGITPDSIFTGGFEEELMAAGKRYESNFQEILDTVAFNEVLAFNSRALGSEKGNLGCYRVLDNIQLPEF